MLIPLERLVGCKLEGTDGEIGKLEDVLFDDQSWTVRYMVVGADSRLGRAALISPAVLDEVDLDHKRVTSVLDSESVRESPDVDAHKPVSRQQEATIRTYYNWPVYWGATAVTQRRRIGMSFAPDLATPRETAPAPIRDAVTTDRSREDVHLRSGREVDGYTIEAANGDIGKLDELVLDGSSWEIRYLVVKTGGWLSSRRVIVAPEWIATVIAAESRLRTDLDRESIQSAPEFDPDRDLNRSYEERLFSHYARAPYWR